VRHEHEKGAIKTKFKPNRVKKIVYRNQFIFAWKNSDNSNLFKNIIWLPYHLINSIISGDYVMFLGFVSAVTRLPGILKSRIKAHKLFKYSDSEIISLVTNGN
jgi:hypothetical protein